MPRSPAPLSPSSRSSNGFFVEDHDQRAAYKNYSKAGVLYKERDFLSGRRPRLFVLDSQLLHYYINPTDPAPRRTIFLLGCKIAPESVEEAADGKKYYPFVVSHKRSAMEYRLSATSETAREEWVTKLREASGMGAKGPKAEEENEGEKERYSNDEDETEDGDLSSDIASATATTTTTTRLSESPGSNNRGRKTATGKVCDFMSNVPSRYHAKLEGSIENVLSLVNSDGWQPKIEGWARSRFQARENQQRYFKCDQQIRVIRLE